MRKNIEKLLASDVSGYKISQSVQVSEAKISRLRKGQIKLDNITLLTAERLNHYYENNK